MLTSGPPQFSPRKVQEDDPSKTQSATKSCVGRKGSVNPEL